VAALTVVAAVSMVAALARVAGANPKPTPSPSPSPSPSSSPPPAAAAYSITDLGSLGGGYTEGLAINDNYTIQYAKAINDKGQIVADAYTPTYQTHTLLLTPN
jgi:hypothetical protein